MPSYSSASSLSNYNSMERFLTLFYDFYCGTSLSSMFPIPLLKEKNNNLGKRILQYLEVWAVWNSVV